MSDFAIKVENLTKIYHLYENPVGRLKESLHPFRKKYHRDFYALKNVDFEIAKGETVGIIGRNGCGKSTLLQLISGVLTPTTGTITINGKIAALLELGTGFNPELSGIENVYFNGTLMGFTREEMDAKIDAILGFADIGEFVYQPVKTYSSGMMVRLAFAVAINVDPQIFIVDEALAVGDELFQRKCFSRIETIKEGGATILFVSHSGHTIVELCDHALLLDAGEKLMMGAPKSVVGNYQKLLYAPQDKQNAIREEICASGVGRLKKSVMVQTLHATSPLKIEQITENDPEFFDPNLKSQSILAYESYGAYIELPEVKTITGRLVNCLKSGKNYLYTYKVRFEQDARDVRFGMLIKANNGTELGGIGSAPQGGGIKKVKAGKYVTVSFYFKCNLLPGLYFVNAGCHGQVNGTDDIFLHRISDALTFRVLPTNFVEIRAGYIDFAGNDAACTIDGYR